MYTHIEAVDLHLIHNIDLRRQVILKDLELLNQEMDFLKKELARKYELTTNDNIKLSDGQIIRPEPPKEESTCPAQDSASV